MKSMLVAITLLTLSSLANATPLQGRFENKTSQPVMDAQSRKECRADHGKGGGGDSICMVPSSDSVIVKKVGSVFIVKVDTYGSEMDSCSFKGRGVQTDATHIIASQATDMRKGGAAEDFMPIQGKGLCKIRLTYKGNKLSVSPSRDCEFLCGQQAELSTVVTRR